MFAFLVVFLLVDCVVIVVVITVVVIVCQKSIDLLKEGLRYCLCRRIIVVVACCRCCCLHQIVPSSFHYLTFAMDLDYPTSELLLLLLVSSLKSPILLTYSIANG